MADHTWPPDYRGLPGTYCRLLADPRTGSNPAENHGTAEFQSIPPLLPAEPRDRCVADYPGHFRSRPDGHPANIVSQGQEGKVQSIQLFYTIILTHDNKTIVVPNGQLSNNVTINLSREGDRRLDIELKLSYGIEYADVKKLLEEAIRSVKDVLEEPEFRIGVSKLEADKYTVEINVWIAASGFRDTSMIVHETIMEKLKQGGIKLPGM
ncbi:MAG: mechanosensitive ion channel family protein [Chitinophagaceae bacterium]|nr:MAG: mechanosensitive ion channel family protein [Chitinophagaceae bacterium]